MESKTNKITGITASYKDKTIIIEVPVELLAHSQQGNPYLSLTISDLDAYGQYMADHIVSYDEDEVGDSALYRVFDGLTEHAYEDGEDFLYSYEDSFGDEGDEDEED